MSQQPLKDRDQFLRVAGTFEFSLILVALGLGWIFSVDPTEYLIWNWSALFWGSACVLPLLAAYFILDRAPLSQLKDIQNLLMEVLGKPLSKASYFEIAILALLAGIGEELLFRGFLQHGLESWQVLKDSLGSQAALWISSLLFGLMHAVTIAYALIATLAGAYLGYILDVTGERNLLIPMITHSLYDFLAFLMIVHSTRAKENVN